MYSASRIARQKQNDIPENLDSKCIRTHQLFL